MQEPTRSHTLPCNLAALCLFIAAFFLFHAHADFPFYYHTDEPGKVKQVMTGARNFHHPVLLLNLTSLLAKNDTEIPSKQGIVETGRMVSALSAALSVAALTLLAWNLSGFYAGILTGLLVMSHSVLFELAHYLKEDCILLAGMAISFLAFASFDQKPGVARISFCGIAAGLTISGKYVGGSMLVLGILFIIFKRWNEKRAMFAEIAIFILTAGLVFAAINHQLVASFSEANSGINGEFARIDGNRQSSGWSVFKYSGKLGTDISVPIVIGACYLIFKQWKNRQKERIFSWLLVSFPILYFIAMSVTPVSKERYLLPAFVFACVVGSLGLVKMMRSNHQRIKWFGATLAVLALGWNFSRTFPIWRDFANDDRRDLVSWINHHLTPETIIAEDVRAKLSLGQKWGTDADQARVNVIAEGTYAGSLGSIKELKARNIYYVVVCDYDRQRVRTLNRSAKNREETIPLLNFYDQLEKSETLVWSRPPSSVGYLHPGLKLYRLGNNL